MGRRARYGGLKKKWLDGCNKVLVFLFNITIPWDQKEKINIDNSEILLKKLR